MILTGPEIEKRVKEGSIVIEPFDPKCINPNSYNLHLSDNILLPTKEFPDIREPDEYKEFTIPQEGAFLYPKTLYLGSTVEWTETERLVPQINGRSSIGRLGLMVHVTAGYGDIGFKGCWTLELFAVRPIRVYPNIPIAQIYYSTIEGDVLPYKGKYGGSKKPMACEIWKEL